MTEQNQTTVKDDPIRRLSALVNAPPSPEKEEARLEALIIEQKDQANQRMVAGLILLCALIFCFLLLTMFNFAIKGSILLAGACVMAGTCKSFSDGKFFKGLTGLTFSSVLVGIVINLL